MKYSFYLKEKEGYKLYSIDAKDVYIKYTDNKPKLEMFSETETDAFINNFSLKAELKTNYIIYIPKGSIINNYTLDTK